MLKWFIMNRDTVKRHIKGMPNIIVVASGGKRYVGAAALFDTGEYIVLFNGDESQNIFYQQKPYRFAIVDDPPPLTYGVQRQKQLPLEEGKSNGTGKNEKP